MKKFIKYTGIAFLAASFLTACTGAFEDMNTNPKGVTDEELKQDGNYIGAPVSYTHLKRFMASSPNTLVELSSNSYSSRISPSALALPKRPMAK